MIFFFLKTLYVLEALRAEAMGLVWWGGGDRECPRSPPGHGHRSPCERQRGWHALIVAFVRERHPSGGTLL